MTNNTTHVRDIMHYESDIWAIADLLLAAAVKQSDFPAYMMPFFALVMLEGRMRNAVREVEKENGITAESDPEDFKELFELRDCGYNEFIVMEGKTLQKICSNDTTFEQDFHAYLQGFDPDLKRLLGVDRGQGEQKFLNMDGIVAELRGKKILMEVVTKWAEIDLSPYDNSAITTLEEHIKRKWADISASTAGEQYTPDDIISLIAEIVADKITKPKHEVVHVYDPTCGGANLLFGVADRLAHQVGYEHIATYGSEYNDALYALAAIESRFRDFSQIEYGNTLTRVPFADTAFDVIVANPPYGTKWSGYEKEVKNDQKGQFPGGLPAVSDGQLLFMQHILWQLDSEGIAVEVHNGSTLFSGDAGSGESNIRKYIFDHDWVEAIIQMPQDEFFNTGIYTYLWIMNKNKPAERRNLVALIDGSKGWSLLKKSKGNKRREMLEGHRQAIVQALHDFVPNDICKIFDREHFYYNKQQLTLTELDADGKAIEEPIALTKLKKIRMGYMEYEHINDLDPIVAAGLLAELKAFDWMEDDLEITAGDDTVYRYDREKETLYAIDECGKVALGQCKFTFSLSTSKKMKSVKVTIEPLTTGDYEIIPHHLNPELNDEEIRDFMQQYIFKPFVLGNNTVGVEANFNKEFYVPEELASVEEILAEIRSLNSQIIEVCL